MLCMRNTAPPLGQTAKEHGAEVLANSNWEILHGDPRLSSGADHAVSGP